jgi:hypothetical protein
VDDIKELAVPVLAHRVIPKGSSWDNEASRNQAKQAISDIATSVEIPL